MLFKIEWGMALNHLVLGVDGFCPDSTNRLGYPKMSFDGKFSIPRVLYSKNITYTLKIWPSMFYGQEIDIDLRKVLDSIYERDTIDNMPKQVLIKVGVKKYFKK